MRIHLEKLEAISFTTENQQLGLGWKGITHENCSLSGRHRFPLSWGTQGPLFIQGSHNGCHPALTAARPLVFDPCKSQLAKIIQLCPGSVFLQTPNCVKATFLAATAPIYMI